MSIDNSIDPQSPVPLYHQIAQAIRDRIERGDLNRGDHLQPLRDAAKAWDVNFHTVRHAYAELAREGLVEIRGARGTRVTASISEGSTHRRDSTEVDDFVARFVAQSKTDYGLNPDELSLRIAKLCKSPIVRVHVLECSQHQCEDLSRQLEEAWAVQAVPLSLDRCDELPMGHLVATYFHYNEVRLRWPKRLASFSFVAIAPEQQLATRLDYELKRTGKSMLTVCERDEPTAQAVIADVSALFLANDIPIRSRIVTRPADLAPADDDELLLIPPRVWGELSPEKRGSEDVVEVRYTFDQEELAQVGAAHGWTKMKGQPQHFAKRGRSW